MYYDLHIHSCLSPCASDDMTPGNIAGMAHLKGLSLISLTDHNAGGNLAAMNEAARAFGIEFVPGAEITSREEVHVLTYFAKLKDALRFMDKIYGSLPDVKNHPELFGNQILCDSDDNPAGMLSKLLLQATPFSVDELASMVKASGGVAVPAHINRDSFSMLANLGFIPPGLFSAVEIAKSLPCPEIDGSLKRLYSSDAHLLGDIAEPENELYGVKNAEDLIALLRG